MKKITLIALFLSFTMSGYSQFRVVGYVFARNDSLIIPDQKVLEKLTHVNIAFVNPDSAGDLQAPQNFDNFISQLHTNGRKVLMSIGGGTANNNYSFLLKDEHRQSLVKNMVALCVESHLDGIDVDLENDAIDENYDAFIHELHAALRSNGKLITAAIATWKGKEMNTQTLKLFDFINIMSYDQTGPWRPDEPGPHSTYEQAVAELDYWLKERGFDKKDLNLGLPFYGYCFGCGNYPSSLGFRVIDSTFTDAAQKDFLVPDGGGALYYNGIPTIRRKTELALKKAGGLMIWEISQDAAGESSLLSTIEKVIRENAE